MLVDAVKSRTLPFAGISLMRRIPALAAVCLMAGCQGKTHVTENPVVGPPPPRIAGAADFAAQTEQTVRNNLDEVVQVDAVGDGTGQLSVGDPQASPLGPPGQVAARVNGIPIFTAEVLEPYGARLAEVQAQVPPEQFEQLQQQLLQRDLPQYIDQLVLYDEVMNQLDADQLDQMRSQLDKFFQLHLEQLMAEQNLRTLAELQAKLQASGMSLESARRAFERQEIAMQYLRESVKANPSVSRSELLAEYHARQAEYTQPARIRWQQIRISFARHGGRAGAEAALQAALDDLGSGTSFEEAARRHSDGPLASQGGEWDWTQLDSISDEGLRETLAPLPVGDVSQPLETSRAFLIVKLTGSRPQETTPFQDVQDELRETISNRKRQESIQAVVKDVKSRAVITTLFDDDAAEP
jgi:parvulin-like peptidyl-prolyl isomerase